MSNVTNAMLLEAINGIKVSVANLDARVSKLENQKTRSSGSSKAKSSSKKSSNSDFDRNLYEETAKKLGCFAYGKVVSTVDGNGKRISREENRQRVYDAMGYKK